MEEIMQKHEGKDKTVRKLGQIAHATRMIAILLISWRVGVR
jgi:hypothetical protein